MKQNQQHGITVDLLEFRERWEAETTGAPTNDDIWERARLITKVRVLTRIAPLRNLLANIREWNAQRTSHKAVQCEGIKLTKRGTGRTQERKF